MEVEFCRFYNGNDLELVIFAGSYRETAEKNTFQRQVQYSFIAGGGENLVSAEEWCSRSLPDRLLLQRKSGSWYDISSWTKNLWHFVLLLRVYVLLVLKSFKSILLGGFVREGFKKKNWEKAVRLTAWVDPPLPPPPPWSGQENVKFFDFDFWL